MEVIGAGVGSTFIQGTAISYQGPVIQVNVQVGASGSVTFSDISMNPGTFSGVGGMFANQMIGLSNFNCAACKLVMERVELNIHHTSSSGGLSPLGFSSLGPVEMRDTVIHVTGGASNAPAGINAIGGVPLLIEDFTINGGNAPFAGVLYAANNCAFCGPNTLTVRRERQGVASCFLHGSRDPLNENAQGIDTQPPAAVPPARTLVGRRCVCRASMRSATSV